MDTESKSQQTGVKLQELGICLGIRISFGILMGT
jgi:hypothetical protein